MASLERDRRPFENLLHLLRAHFHSDVYDQRQVEDLRSFYALPHDEQPEWARQFKVELQQVLRGNTNGLDCWDIFNATDYGQDNDRDFLELIWEELFPDESVPGRE